MANAQDLGGRTEDLRSVQPPAPQKSVTRKSARIYLAVGIGLFLTPILGLLLWLAIDRDSMIDPVNAVLALAGFGAFAAPGTGLAATGLIALQNCRNMVQLLEAADRFQIRLLGVENRQAGMEHVMELSRRTAATHLESMREAVAGLPGYRQGMLDGLSQQQDILDRMGLAIDRIAEQLPHDQEIRHWRGFSAAVKDGFVSQQTGTDGPTASAAGRRLGLVKGRDGQHN